MKQVFTIYVCKVSMLSMLGLFSGLGESLLLLRRTPMQCPGSRWHSLDAFSENNSYGNYFSGEGVEHGVWVPAQCCQGRKHR